MEENELVEIMLKGSCHCRPFSFSLSYSHKKRSLCEICEDQRGYLHWLLSAFPSSNLLDVFLTQMHMKIIDYDDLELFKKCSVKDIKNSMECAIILKSIRIGKYLLNQKEWSNEDLSTFVQFAIRQGSLDFIGPLLTYSKELLFLQYSYSYEEQRYDDGTRNLCSLSS